MFISAGFGPTDAGVGETASFFAAVFKVVRVVAVLAACSVGRVEVRPVRPERLASVDVPLAELG